MQLGWTEWAVILGILAFGLAAMAAAAFAICFIVRKFDHNPSRSAQRKEA